MSGLKSCRKALRPIIQEYILKLVREVLKDESELLRMKRNVEAYNENPSVLTSRRILG
jgi:hypothetical protein